MATAETRLRGRLFDAEETLNMLMDSDCDDSSDEIGEPMCPGSDEEFPDPDLDPDVTGCDNELSFRYVNKQGKFIIDKLLLL